MELTEQRSALSLLSILLLTTGLTVSVAAVPANDFLSHATTAAVQNIIDLTIRQQYDRALQRCRKLQAELPQHPVGYFFEAATLQAMMLDYEADAFRERFLELTAQVQRLCKKALQEQPENSWLYFFYGGALGYEAYLRGREQEYLTAFREGWESIQYLERAVQLDSTNFDARLGIGVYKYYRSKLGKFLAWLPFVHNERREGIRLIELARRRGTFSKAAATNALIWIFISEKEFERAQALIDSSRAHYPDSRFFMWSQATVALRTERFHVACEIFERIIASYAAEGVRSAYNELVCHSRLAELYAELENQHKAAEHARQALALEIPRSYRKKAGEYRKRAENVLQAVDNE